MADLAEAKRYPKPAKVFFAPKRCCAQTAEVLYPHLLSVPAAFLAPEAFEQPREGSLHALKTILQEMMQAGFTESAVIVGRKELQQLLEACALPELLADDWKVEPCAGYTLLTDAALWMRSEKLELYDTVPSSEQDTQEADDEAYLDYAESLLDDEVI